MTDKIVVFSTCASAEEAERIARHLIDRRLAACVNVVPQIRSFYRWKGAVENSDEWLLIIKTSRPLFDQVRVLLEAVHSYEVPEVLALPVVAASPNYLAWLTTELAGEEDPAGD